MGDMNAQSTSYGAAASYRSFEDLEVYRAAREFRVALYRVAKRLPDFEKFGLASQMRRAAVSLTNNLAEGHGRFHFLDQIRFTLISRGSLEEWIDDLNVCADKNYLPAPELATLKSTAWQMLKLTNGYLRYLRDRKQGESLQLKETSPAYDPSAAASEAMDWRDELLDQHPDFLAGIELRTNH
jgi:four helix bundle protein